MSQYIRKLHIKNIARITEVQVEPSEQGLISVCGTNAAGKTSLLRSIYAGFGGKVPELRNGEKQGEVKIETDDLQITLYVSEAKDKLVVESRDEPGKQVRSPKKLLKSIFGKRAFDVFAFLNATSKAQIDILLGVVNIPADFDHIVTLCDNRIELSKTDTVIEWINNAYKQITEERRVVNRECKRLQGVIDTYKDIEDIESIDIEPLLRLKEEALNREKLKQELLTQEKEIERLEQLLSAAKAKAKDIKDTLDTLEPYELSEIEEQIKTAKYSNALAVKCKDKKIAIENLQEKSKESALLTDILKSILDYKVELMAQTDFPVSGLDIRSGQIFYNDHPLVSASGAEQLIVATAIAAAEIPKDGLQALFIFDPPQLDIESWKLLESFAEKEKSKYG